MVDQPLSATPDGRTSSRRSVFDRAAARYAFLREHMFRDDTARIIAALWPDGEPGSDEHLVEIGCGPGVYARRLAARFPQLRVTGIDESDSQLELARARASAAGLDRCLFVRGNALRLPLADGSVDAIVASRLLAVVGDPATAVAEMHRVLRPGGRCFIAEPRHPWQVALPLLILRLGAQREPGATPSDGAPATPHRVLDRAAFRSLVDRPGWRVSPVHVDAGYQYAICRRPA